MFNVLEDCFKTYLGTLEWLKVMIVFVDLQRYVRTSDYE